MKQQAWMLGGRILSTLIVILVWHSLCQATDTFLALSVGAAMIIAIIWQ